MTVLRMHKSFYHIVTIVSLSVSLNTPLERVETFQNIYTLEPDVDPNSYLLTCIATYYELGNGLQKENCSNKLLSTDFSRVHTFSYKKTWTLTVEIKIQEYWNGVKVGTTERSLWLSNYLTRSGPYMISTTNLSSMTHQKFFVVHGDMFWKHLTFVCLCKDNPSDCSRFVQCSDDVTIDPRILQSNITSECNITTPFGDSGLVCKFSYKTGKLDSKELSHTFSFPRTKPNPLQNLTIRVPVTPSISKRWANVTLSAKTSKDSVQSFIIFQCTKTGTQKLISRCVVQAKGALFPECAMSVPVTSGQFYDFRALTRSPFPLSPVLENSTSISETFILLEPSTLRKNSSSSRISELQFAIQISLEQRDDSVQSHVNISFYSNQDNLLNRLKPILYSLKDHQIEDSPMYNISIVLSSPFFTPGDIYKMKVSTLSCLSDCSSLDQKRESSDNLNIPIQIPAEPFGPVDIQLEVTQLTKHSLTVLISWRPSNITTHDKFRVNLCKGKSSCEASVLNVLFFQTALSYMSFEVFEVGYYYGRVVPSFGKTFGDGKSFNTAIVPEKPKNLTVEVVHHVNRDSITAIWEMDINSSYMFTITVCKWNTTTNCLYQQNVTETTRSGFQFTYTYNRKKTLSGGLYFLSVRARYDSLVGEESRRQFYLTASTKYLTGITTLLAIASLLTALAAARAAYHHKLVRVSPHVAFLSRSMRTIAIPNLCPIAHQASSRIPNNYPKFLHLKIASDCCPSKGQTHSSANSHKSI